MESFPRTSDQEGQDFYLSGFTLFTLATFAGNQHYKP